MHSFLFLCDGNSGDATGGGPRVLATVLYRTGSASLGQSSGRARPRKPVTARQFPHDSHFSPPAPGRRQKAEGEGQKAKSRRQKGKGKRIENQKRGARRNGAGIPRPYFCLLPSAFCL
jgi:hypothetical protein